MIVDSHCHLDRLDLQKYDGKLENALNYARSRGVEHFLCVSVTLEDFPTILAIAESSADISCSVGVHPTDGEMTILPYDKMLELASHKKVVAIGETGLDYYRSPPEVTAMQQENFRLHIRAALDLKKPLIIHTRMASNDTLTILKEEGAEKIGGVMHCFTETWEVAKAALDLNFYISISGIVTFKNAEEIREVAKQIPMDRLLIETDSPYLAPVPYRGKSNEPAYVREVAEFIAELRGLSFEELSQKTTENFYRLFMFVA